APNLASLALHPRLSDLTDSRVEVDARKLAGPDESSVVGIMCRARDFDNFYLLAITSDGFAAIVKVKADKATVLAAGNPAAAIRQGNATNRLRADCVGST